MGDSTPSPMGSCADCGGPLKTKRAIRCKSCSTRHRYAQTKVPRYCKHCGNEIAGSNRLKAIYCRKECKFADPEFRAKMGLRRAPDGTMQPNPNRVTKTCPACMTSFTVPQSTSGRYNYCSQTCSSTRGEDAPCLRCGTVFRRPVRSDRKHCSERCRRPPVRVNCLHCGKEVRVTPSKASRQRYCSVRCYRSSSAETIIEKVVRLLLERANIAHTPQARLGRWVVDFLVGEHLVIETDGTYWHSLRPDVDRRKTAYLTSRGYTVWRLPEEKVMQADFPQVFESMLDAYQSARGLLPRKGASQPSRALRLGTTHPAARPGRARGERQAKAKLNAIDVLFIRASKEDGASIARRFGVGRSTIHRVRSAKNWIHVA